MNRDDAKYILEIIREETIPPTARLVWVELRLSELFNLSTKSILNSTQMRRRNRRLLQQRYLVSMGKISRRRASRSNEDWLMIAKETVNESNNNL